MIVDGAYSRPIVKRIPLFWRFVLALAAVTLVIAILTPHNLGQTDARRTGAERDIPALFNDLPLPADAKPHGPQSQNTIQLRRRFGVVVEQEFERPGAYASTDALYQRELPALGWIEYDHSSVNRRYCKAPYTFEVEQRAVFPDSHRFALRLTYDDSQGGRWQCAAR